MTLGNHDTNRRFLYSRNRYLGMGIAVQWLDLVASRLDYFRTQAFPSHRDQTREWRSAWAIHAPDQGWRDPSCSLASLHTIALRSRISAFLGQLSLEALARAHLPACPHRKHLPSRIARFAQKQNRHTERTEIESGDRRSQSLGDKASFKTDSTERRSLENELKLIDPRIPNVHMQ